MVVCHVVVCVLQPPVRARHARHGGDLAAVPVGGQALWRRRTAAHDAGRGQTRRIQGDLLSLLQTPVLWPRLWPLFAGPMEWRSTTVVARRTLTRSRLFAAEQVVEAKLEGAQSCAAHRLADVNGALLCTKCGAGKDFGERVPVPYLTLPISVFARVRKRPAGLPSVLLQRSESRGPQRARRARPRTTSSWAPCSTARYRCQSALLVVLFVTLRNGFASE